MQTRIYAAPAVKGLTVLSFSGEGNYNSRAFGDKFWEFCMVLGMVMPILFAMDFENIMSIPNTMSNFKNLSASARLFQI